MNTQKENRDSGSVKRIPYVISALNSQGLSYRVIEAQSPEAEAVADWIESHFPIVGVQIDWAKLPTSRCMEWSETVDLVSAFESLVREMDQSTKVVVTWSNARYPSLEMRLCAMLKVASAIFESCFDTWVLCEADNWCIEAHHEGTICFGHGRPGIMFLGVKEM